MNPSNIKLFGTERCHKTRHYRTFLEKQTIDYRFLDVEKSKTSTDELRALFINRKLNFPTILIGEKKLRNPSDEELDKWLKKLK